jgi:vancomycin resistance protein YoaR
MAIDDQYDGEVVNGATNFHKRAIAVSTRSSSTNKSKAHLEAVYRDTHRQIYQAVDRQVYQEIDQDSTEAAYRERKHEFDQMVTEADFERRLTSQCQLPMTTGCKIYSPEHAEALRRVRTAQARMNLVSITN